MRASRKPNMGARTIVSEEPGFTLSKVPTSSLPHSEERGPRNVSAVGQQPVAPHSGPAADWIAGPQPTTGQGTQQQVVEGRNVILHRNRQFFVRTAYRPDQKRNPLHKPTGNTSVFSR